MNSTELQPTGKTTFIAIEKFTTQTSL